MQICALSSDNSLVFAKNANRHQDYQCLECKEKVRLRRGLHRQAHFYHCQPNRLCRQHAKGMPHLMVQHFLKNILPEEEAEIECSFSSIGRIADVAWHPKRLIYEIQCSPITAEEVKARNQSYASIGYQVVWIFHDERYNQYRLTSAESSLIDQPHYFTDMDALGEGKIYDQPSTILNGKRVGRLPTLSIDPSTPKFLNKEDLKRCQKLLPVLKRRAKDWPCIFSGDAIDTYFSGNENEVILTANGSLSNSLLKFIYHFWQNRIARPYQAVLKLLLERACR
jgi:competence protein CoiA